MSLFGFSTRKPQRDRETDLGRFDRLSRHLHELRAEIDAEREGLRKRYREAQASAAFALEVYENGESAALSAKADELCVAMRRYDARIDSLEKQAAFMQGAEADARAFLDSLSIGDEEPVEAD
jgi:hypothetical protein